MKSQAATAPATASAPPPRSRSLPRAPPHAGDRRAGGPGGGRRGHAGGHRRDGRRPGHPAGGPGEAGQAGGPRRRRPGRARLGGRRIRRGQHGVLGAAGRGTVPASLAPISARRATRSATVTTAAPPTAAATSALPHRPLPGRDRAEQPRHHQGGDQAGDPHRQAGQGVASLVVARRRPLDRAASLQRSVLERHGAEVERDGHDGQVDGAVAARCAHAGLRAADETIVTPSADSAPTGRT